MAIPKEAGVDEPPTVLFGRFMLPDMSEHPCQVAQLSPDGAVFMTSSVPPPGLSIVAYINEIGRVEATTGDATEGGFQVVFLNTGARRERIEERIKWLNDNKGGSAANRRHARFEPKDTKSHLTLPDGRTYPCEVIDISLSGAAIKIDVMPALGTYLYLGKMRGRVVRYHETGIAIEFTRQLERSALAEHVR
jgi:hypothetical protein